MASLRVRRLTKGLLVGKVIVFVLLNWFYFFNWSWQPIKGMDLSCWITWQRYFSSFVLMWTSYIIFLRKICAVLCKRQWCLLMLLLGKNTSDECLRTACAYSVIWEGHCCLSHPSFVWCRGRHEMASASFEVVDGPLLWGGHRYFLIIL